MFVRDLFLPRRFFILLWGCSLILLLSFFIPAVFTIARVATVLAALFFAVDCYLLFRTGSASATRRISPRLSNGDDNPVDITVTSSYPFDVICRLIDETPPALMNPASGRTIGIAPRGRGWYRYGLRPVKRGEYRFGFLNMYVRTPIGLAIRRFRQEEGVAVKVYPSLGALKRYGTTSIAWRREGGARIMPRGGASVELDRIRPWVAGDEMRQINWAATARRGEHMVNQFRDERSRPVYCVLDTGRSMAMTFAGMSILDYAINAATALCALAMRHDDRPGLVLLGSTVDNHVPSGRGPARLQRILEAMYRCEPGAGEASFEDLARLFRERIRGRSLVLLFTNFESYYSLERNMDSLSLLARYHHLLVVFFENTEVRDIRSRPVETLADVYEKTVAERFALDKKKIQLTLERRGIGTILATPGSLTEQTIDMYLDIKTRGIL